MDWDLPDQLAARALPRLRRASPVDSGRLAGSWSLTSEGFVSSEPYMPFVMARQAADVVAGAVADVMPTFEAAVVATIEGATEQL